MTTLVTESEFRDNFLGKCDPPIPLMSLLGYQLSATEDYSGNFALYKDGRDSLSMFFRDEDVAQRFVAFGVSADGSLYALWLYRDNDCDTAPVVFLDSDGPYSVVLANSLFDFLALLGLGVEELGSAAAKQMLSPVPASDKATVRFRHWLQREFGIIPPSDPMQSIQSAAGRHPNLQQWIEDTMLGD